uniref:Uncharacterized protein n=1 Tax=Lactuca sativa TaxID=4236 RepID=A0A9R1V5R7_LACSA|nr:hypothetical protein LSAT_V11C600330510 [Lactuca sativa]
MKMHDDLEQKVDLTLKCMVDAIIKDYFSRLTQSQLALFEASPFGRFLAIHGDPLLVHLIMLHEVQSQQVLNREDTGVQLDFGETKYILISGLSLFPDIIDSHLRLRDFEEYIMSPNYLQLQDEDAIMLIQLVFMLKGLHGQDVKICIFVQTNPKLMKIYKYTVLGFMLPFKTFPEAT